MAETLRQHLTNKVEGSALNTDPFPFLYINDFFPDAYYKKLHAIYPPEQLFKSYSEKSYNPTNIEVVGRSTLAIYNEQIKFNQLKDYKFRKEIIDFREFYRSFLIPLIAKKLNITLPQVWSDHTSFVTDKEGYLKRPHTDHPLKIFSILLYMSNSARGTTMVRPKEKDFADSNGYDHRFNQFENVYEVPFRPNSILAFERTNTSFHCVHKVGAGENRQAIHIFAVK